MNMLEAIMNINKQERMTGWMKYKTNTNTQPKYDHVKVWEDDKEWKDIKPADWDD